MNIKELIYAEKQALIPLCLLQLMSTILTLGIAWQLSQVVYNAFLGDIAQITAVNLGLLLFLLIAKALVNYPFRKQLHGISQKLQYQIRHKLHQALSYNEFASDRLQLLAMETTEALGKLCTDIAPPVLALLFLMPMLLLTVALLDPWSAIIMLITLPITPIILYLIGRVTKSATLSQWKKLGLLAHAFQDLLSGIISLKIFRQEEAQGRRLAELSHDFTTASLKVLRLAFVSSFALELLTTLTIAILAVSIGLRLLYGEMGFQIAFFLLLLLPDFYQPLRQGGMVFHAVTDVQTALEQLQPVIDQQPITASGHHEELRLPPPLRVDHITFTYPGAPLPTLTDLSLKFAPGRITCIHGTSGMGKTTLLKILAGILVPQTGMVWLEDKELQKISPHSRQRLITYIPQLPHVFQGTLGENVCLFDGDEQNNNDKIHHALSVVGLNLNPDIPLGAGGQDLSHGQKHRLGLARAIYQDRPVVLLDEPTAGMEPSEEAELLKSLGNWRPHRTIIVVSHHKAVRQWADAELEVQHD